MDSNRLHCLRSNSNPIDECRRCLPMMNVSWEGIYPRAIRPALRRRQSKSTKARPKLTCNLLTRKVQTLSPWWPHNTINYLKSRSFFHSLPYIIPLCRTNTEHLLQPASKAPGYPYFILFCYSKQRWFLPPAHGLCPFCSLLDLHESIAVQVLSSGTWGNRLIGPRSESVTLYVMPMSNRYSDEADKHPCCRITLVASLY